MGPGGGGGEGVVYRGLGEEGKREGKGDLQFQEVELGFFRHDLVDVGAEEGVGFCDFGPESALHRGFDFGFGSG